VNARHRQNHRQAAEGARAAARLLWIASALLLLAVTFAACGSGSAHSCTAIGCSSEVSVELPDLRGPAGKRLVIELCVDGECKRIPRVLAGDDLDGAPVYQAMPPSVRSVEISVTVRDSDGKVVERAKGKAPVKVTHPNGADCPPECRRVAARADAGRLIEA
jgi:hypothetical protein